MIIRREDMKVPKWILLGTDEQWIWRYVMGALMALLLLAMLLTAGLILRQPENFLPHEIMLAKKNFAISLKWLVIIYLGGETLMLITNAIKEKSRLGDKK